MTVSMELQLDGQPPVTEAERPAGPGGATPKHGNGMSMSHVLATEFRLLMNLMIRTVGSLNIAIGVKFLTSFY